MSSARERRRMRNASEPYVAANSPGDSERKFVIGVGSEARLKRRDLIEKTQSLKDSASQGIASNLEFEVLRRTMEAYSSQRLSEDSQIRRQSTSGRPRPEGIRFSDDSQKMDMGKPAWSHESQNPTSGYRKLNRTSLERTLLDESLNRMLDRKSDKDTMNSYVKILSTLLPDEILKDINEKDAKKFHAVILFADVSGFTELSEKFDKTGKGGPSRLTEILNAHIGAMIQVVMSRDGDTCKFGGDAILCFWRATTESSLRKVVCAAIDSALEMQRNSGTGIRETGVQIRVKVSIAAGEVIFSTIGESRRKYYVLVGRPVIETTEAEKLCQPGEVIVAPSAWKHVPNFLIYTHTLHADKIHITVQDFGPLWTGEDSKVGQRGSDSFSLRPTLKSAESLHIEELRPFVLPFVMKCIDNREPLDYLTEMRQVTIVFLKMNVMDLSLPSVELVHLCDKTYRVVCEIVESADGTVNKLTCFDKDLCILVVFGLRGFKCELASKTALKCAYNCVEVLKPLSGSVVSAGVTTGMAYCGVIGHVLRREYSVMGLPVNKAARLMCAYENRVSCDRETFLQSKYHSSHFIVLEKKALKGIQNIGPVYEFSLFVKRKVIDLVANTQPILGRSREIAEFDAFLRGQGTYGKFVNFFVVFGGARIGKTRFLTTIVRLAEKYFSGLEQNADVRENLDVCFIPLSEEDYKSSYSTVRLIFEPALGLTESSTPEEREEKIKLKLGEIKDTHVLATLNPIFNVKFRLTNHYLRMSQEEQFNAKWVMKKRLYKVCFPSHSRWLIAIDDAEFIDEDSWVFLKWCCTVSSRPLFLLTIGQQKSLSPSASECLLTIPQKSVVLTEIDKWFYTALACQILEVKAIPVELENLLQGFKNSGNPGWLESYLLSMIQTEGLHVSYVTRGEMNAMKLVATAESGTERNSLHGRTESPFWLDWMTSFKPTKESASEVVPVCVLGPKFRDNVQDSELTMDMMHVKTIDRLKPLEQLILKAGSVIGYNFKRDALSYLISKEIEVEERPFAKAIKSLFEFRILSCDKGDFTCPSSLITNRRAILHDNSQKDIKCNCIGLVRSAALQNLPDYAACGFMRFRSPVFKDTVYNLLLDDQKKKFHQSSIDFLRNNTYKCKACNSVLFDRIFGVQVGTEVQLVCASTPMHGVRSTKMMRHHLSKSYLRRRTTREERMSGCSLTTFPDDNSLVHVDIIDCQCPQVLSTVYAALLEHAERAGRKDIMLEVSFEYASVSLTSNNIPLTSQILDDALALAKVIQEEKEYPEFCTPFIFGKIYTLMGATNLSMGRTDTALSSLETALKYLGKRVPKKHLMVIVDMFKVEMEMRFVTRWFPNLYIGKPGTKKAAYLDLVSECLGFMCTVHMSAKNWVLAKFTSSWALNNAFRSNRNFYGLCTSCANVMVVAYNHNDQSTCAKMEVFALNLCENCSKQLLEMYELEAIARLYKNIFRARHLRAELDGAIEIGFKSIRIASIIRNFTLRLELMPDLIFALIQSNRLSEAMSLLQELESTAVQYCDKTGRIWYYAICMDVQLDTGYTMVPYTICEQFVNEEEENLHGLLGTDATERLCTAMWLWCIRNGEWDASKRYSKLLRRQVRIATPSVVYAKLQKYEGLLISLADKLDNRHMYSGKSLVSEIRSLGDTLKKETRIVPLLKPRYLLLKAYHMRICRRRRVSLLLLARAKDLATKMNDKNTLNWVTHNKLVWDRASSQRYETFWNNHCKYEDFIDWHEADNTSGKEAFMYTLPLPG